MPAPDKLEPLAFKWRFDGRGVARRVWRTDWDSWRSEVLNVDDFDALQRMCSRFSIPLKEADDD